MSDEAKVRALLEPLLARPVDVTGGEVDRERIARAILRAGGEASAAPSAGKQLGWILAAAATVLLVGGAAALWQTQRSEPVSSKSRPVAASPPRVGPAFLVDKARGSVTRSEGGSTLSTGPASSVEVRSGDDLRVELAENTRVSLAGLSDEPAAPGLQLVAGAIRCRSASATTGFTVVTPGAVLRVHAALFSVDVLGDAASPSSCVKVETGQLVVEAAGTQQVLKAGDTWGCAAGRPVEPSVRSTSPEPKPSRSREAESALPGFGGTLDEENRLFQAGLSSERSGNAQAAAASFRALLTRYPKSPLASDAQRALQRVTRAPSTP